MDKEETVYLTEAMMNSGDVIDLSDIGGIKVDSTVQVELVIKLQ